MRNAVTLGFGLLMLALTACGGTPSRTGDKPPAPPVPSTSSDLKTEELIIGSWRPRAGGVSGSMEFEKGGRVFVVDPSGTLKGTYKFVEADRIRLEVADTATMRTSVQQYTVVIKKDQMELMDDKKLCTYWRRNQ